MEKSDLVAIESNFVISRRQRLKNVSVISEWKDFTRSYLASTTIHRLISCLCVVNSLSLWNVTIIKWMADNSRKKKRLCYLWVNLFLLRVVFSVSLCACVKWQENRQAKHQHTRKHFLLEDEQRRRLGGGGWWKIPREGKAAAAAAVKNWILESSSPPRGFSTFLLFGRVFNSTAQLHSS